MTSMSVDIHVSIKRCWGSKIEGGGGSAGDSIRLSEEMNS